MNDNLKGLEDIYSIKKTEFERLSQIDWNSVQDYWHQLAVLDLQIKKLETSRDHLIDARCDSCLHPQDFLVESPYRESTFFDFPPWRLCKLCGAAEKGWSYDFVKPKIVTKYVTSGELPQVTSDDLIKLTTKVYDKEE